MIAKSEKVFAKNWFSNLSDGRRTASKALRAGVAALLLGGVLSGCEGVSLSLPGLTSVDGPVQADFATVDVGGRIINVVPPAGFCIDPQTSRWEDTSPQIVVGDCRALDPANGNLGELKAEDLRKASPIHAVLTVQFTDGPLYAPGENTEVLRELETYFRTETGRATLASSGHADQISVIQSRIHNDTLYLLSKEENALSGTASSPRVWRGFGQVMGRMTTMSISSFDNYYAGDQVLLRYLISFREAIRRANSAQAG